MITISQGTISAFRKEPQQIVSDTEKMATLLLCCRSYRTSWRFFLIGTAASALLLHVLAFVCVCVYVKGGKQCEINH